MNQGIQFDIDRVMAEAVATGRFVSSCTIQAHNGHLIVGSPDPNGWANLAGHLAIPCMASAISALEKKELGQETSVSMLHVLLSGLYPAIETRHRAIIDAVTYDILGVDQDSQSQMTTMEVRRAEL